MGQTMAVSKLHLEISAKSSDKEEIAVQVIHEPELLSDIFRGLSADKASIKFGCDKILRTRTFEG